jgi:hypothetical protein
MVVCKTFWFIIIANCRVEFGRMIPAISGVLEPERGKKVLDSFFLTIYHQLLI